MKKLQLFDQNQGLCPLQKCQFCLLSKSMFIWSRKACFLKRTSPNNFSRCILHKTKRKQNLKFLTKTKCQFCRFFKNRCFRYSERLVWYTKRRKSYFYDLFSRSMIWEYTGLQGVTGGYRDYEGLHRVTRGYKG